MKLLIIVCLFTLVGVMSAASDLYPRGCIYALGKCVKECEEGTRAYAVGCDFITPEATCDQPEPQKDDRGVICDYSACYCDPPTVRDAATKKCVKIEECSKKE